MSDHHGQVVIRSPKKYREDIVKVPTISQPWSLFYRSCSRRFRPWRSMLEVRDRSPSRPSPIESVLDLVTQALLETWLHALSELYFTFERPIMSFLFQSKSIVLVIMKDNKIVFAVYLLCRYAARSWSSAINASWCGVLPCRSLTIKEAPPATSMQQMERRLFWAALCKAVCPLKFKYYFKF